MSGLMPPGINIENNEEAVEAVFGFNKTTVAFGRDIISLNSRSVLKYINLNTEARF